MFFVFSVRKCIFCLSQTIGASDAALNIHYWRWCPMLTRCTECSQIIEVATLNDHLISECEKRENFNQCASCLDAVMLSDYETHIKNCQGI